MYGLQDPEPGALYLLLSPGRPRVPRHVGRVQGGAGVGVRLVGEVGELIASREVRLLSVVGRKMVWLPDITQRYKEYQEQHPYSLLDNE